MAIYVVERRLRGLTPEHLAVLHRALAESSRRLSTGENCVRYLRSTYASDRELCVSVFQAASRELVRRVNDVAQVPFEHIDEAIEVEHPG